MRRVAKVAALSGFLGLLLGYLAFYLAFPAATVPPAGEANVLVMVGPMLAAAFLAGLLSDSLAAAMAHAFAAIPIGAAVASALALSPALTGLLVTQPSDVAFFVVRLGLPVFLLALPINVVSTVLGVAIQEKLGLWRR